MALKARSDSESVSPKGMSIFTQIERLIFRVGLLPYESRYYRKPAKKRQ